MTTRRQVNGATFAHRKIVPVITNVPVHAEVEDRRVNELEINIDCKLLESLLDECCKTI